MAAVFHGFYLVVMTLMVAVEKYGLLRPTKFDYIRTFFTPHARHTPETPKKTSTTHTKTSLRAKKLNVY